MKRFLCAAVGLVLALPAFAYPEKPVQLIIPFSAGGDSDLAGRNLAAAAQKILGQPMVAVNKAGASGAIGSQFVRDAAPDGYTLLVARVGSNATLPALKRDLAYKWNDFTFIGLLELNPVVCVVSPESPYRNLADLERALKAQPGKLNYSSSGLGTILNLGSQLMLKSMGVPSDAAVHVAYKGGGEAALAVVSKNVDFSCGNLTSAIGLIKGGKLRAIVVTTPERVKDIPDVPTAREQGHERLEAIVGWTALYGPPGLPREIVKKWEDTLRQVARDPQWLAGEEKLGSIPQIRGAAETAKFVEAQFRVYDELGKSLGIEIK